MQAEEPRWNFFSNHAHVLFYLKAHPDEPLRKVALAVGITERAVQHIVAALEEAGCLKRIKIGRKNQYTFDGSMPLRHSLEGHRTLDDLLNFVEVRDRGSDVIDEYRALENWTVGERGAIT
ncbi:ArsR family transcriptional regulator [Puniceicoccaceae bacterium]|nr:ArsR family transcriptional regulator [Puniceicoccaceae bacterium]